MAQCRLSSVHTACGHRGAWLPHRRRTRSSSSPHADLAKLSAMRPPEPRVGPSNRSTQYRSAATVVFPDPRPASMKARLARTAVTKGVTAALAACGMPRLAAGLAGRAATDTLMKLTPVWHWEDVRHAVQLLAMSTTAGFFRSAQV